VLNQGKLIDSLSKKLASNDKTLEIINNRMDSLSTAIKNQLSFNKMLESQLQQLANIVPTNQDKILGQPKDLETTNLVDIFNAGSYWSEPISKGWNNETLPIKKGDPGRPVIPISIGSVNFNEAIYDFSASVNMMPNVIYV
jgi:methyl-accepting chemotaxis protein